MAHFQEDVAPRKPRRRWLRFSLRTLLILVTLLSIGLGTFVHRGERQRRAVAAVKALGGSIRYDVSGTSPASDTLSRWLPRDYFDDVYLVSLMHCTVTNADLAHISRLTQLEVLELDSTNVTDAGLAHVQGLTELTWLSINETQVTDSGLHHLEGLTCLLVLELRDTQVTDAGLAQLQGLTSLKVLDLSRTPVTDGGVAKLQRALPKCTMARFE